MDDRETTLRAIRTEFQGELIETWKVSLARREKLQSYLDFIDGELAGQDVLDEVEKATIAELSQNANAESRLAEFKAIYGEVLRQVRQETGVPVGTLRMYAPQGNHKEVDGKRLVMAILKRFYPSMTIKEMGKRMRQPYSTMNNWSTWANTKAGLNFHYTVKELEQNARDNHYGSD